MPNPTFRAAVFDFDETMIDLERQHAIADISLCSAMGSDYMSLPEEYRHASGRRVIDDIREMRERFGWSASMEELEEVRQSKFDEACATSELTLLPGVETAIRRLRDAGLTLAITSSAVGSSIERILERLGLREAFALLVDGSEVTHAKPHPEPYLLTAKKLGLRPEECVVFEDSRIGVLSAKAAGTFCIAVRNPNARVRQDLSAADLVLESFEELDPATVV
ncbi:MAG TPA: HAD family phosphatase, partial [Thermoanaerobaculia bacterium]|nr:HAD family phosphatase [Thermoanaerobaculia bacterium]